MRLIDLMGVYPPNEGMVIKDYKTDSVIYEGFNNDLLRHLGLLTRKVELALSSGNKTIILIKED